MQQLLDIARAAGAKNLVVIGGLDWAYDFSGILDGRQLKDPTSNGLVYANHCYNNKNQAVETWIANMEKAAKTLPIIISEFGGAYYKPGAEPPRRRFGGMRRNDAVNECTIAGNLRDMLKTITPANDAKTYLSTVVPSLLVQGLTIAGE